MAGLLSSATASLATSPEPHPPVGRLLIPSVRLEGGYRRHINEHCSATQVGRSAGQPSQWILTAWHCLEYYRDFSRPIVFETRAGQRLQARRVISGGDMNADWALLKLERALPNAVELGTAPIPRDTPLLMAGYSRNRQPAAAPSLSWDSDCRVLGPDGADIQSDCHARRGASGGGVFRRDASGGAYLGVISRGDSEALSVFVPVTRFLDRVSPYLQAP